MLLIRFINKIVNSIKSRKLPNIEFFYNKVILQLLSVLKKNNYLDYKVINKRSYPSPLMEIKIIETKIKTLKLISKPSIKRVISYKDLLSIPFDCIISTSQGLMTKSEAIKNRTGGELLIKLELD